MSSQSRMQILEGAGRAFGRLGYAACRIEDVLEESGISRPTFYKFFSGKEQVFEAVEEAFGLSFVQAMQAAIDPDLAAGEQAEALVDAYLRWAVGQRLLARTMFADKTRPRADRLSTTRDNAFRSFIDLSIDIAAANDRPIADPFVYRGLIGAISEIGMALIDQPRLTDRDLRRARESVLRIVAATLSDRPDDRVPALPLQDEPASGTRPGRDRDRSDQQFS